MLPSLSVLPSGTPNILHSGYIILYYLPLVYNKATLSKDHLLISKNFPDSYFKINNLKRNIFLF